MDPESTEGRTAADIAKPTQEPIAPAFDSLMRDLSSIWDATIKPIFRQMDAFAERWRAQEAETVKTVNAVLDNLPILFKALAAAIADAESDIDRTIERAAVLGHSGWTVTLWMTTAEVKTLCALPLDQVNRFVLEWYEANDGDLTGIESRLLKRSQIEGFQVALAQCFSAYRRGEYAITLPCLVAALECALRACAPAGTFVGSNIEKLIRKRHKKVRDEKADSVTISIWASVLAFVTWFYAQYEGAKATDDRIFRHGIQHGTQSPPNEKVESLRLFHSLDMVTALYSDEVQR